MLCDSHTHFLFPQIAEYTSFYKGAWTDQQRFFRFLEENKINYCLLVYPSTDAHLKLGWAKTCEIYNQNLVLAQQDKRVLGLGLVNLEADIAQQLHTLKEKGLRGISITSSRAGSFFSPRLIQLFKEAEREGLVIFVHPQTINPIGFERVKDPLLVPVLEYSFDLSMFMGILMMEDILENFKVKFIFSSLGGVIPFLKERFDRVYLMLRQRNMVKDLAKPPSEILKKVYVETSGASLANIKLALNLFGEDKVLWGSDYPVNAPIPDNLKLLDSLGQRLKEKITYKNFIDLFGLDKSDSPGQREAI